MGESVIKKLSVLIGYVVFFCLALLVFADCESDDKTIIPNELKEIGGSVLFVKGTNERHIYRFDLSTGQSSLLFTTAFVLTGPQAVAEEKTIYCWSSSGIYKLSDGELHEVIHGRFSYYRYLGNDRMAVLPDESNVLRIIDLANGTSLDIIILPSDYFEMTSFGEMLIFSQRDNLVNYSIHMINASDRGDGKTGFITAGKCPSISPDGKRLAYIAPENHELMVLDMESGDAQSTGIKRVTELAFLKNDWVIYVRWRSRWFNDWLEIGIADCRTGKTYPIDRANAGGLGYGLAWMDF